MLAATKIPMYLDYQNEHNHRVTKKSNLPITDRLLFFFVYFYFKWLISFCNIHHTYQYRFHRF